MVLLYLRSPATGDPLLWAVVPTGILSDPVPLISAPSAVVETLIELLWYNSAAADAWNVADILDSSTLDTLKLFDLSFKLPVPVSSIKEWLPEW